MEIEIVEKILDNQSQVLNNILCKLSELKQRMTEDINKCEESLKQKPYFSSVQFRGQLKRQVRKFAINPHCLHQ